MKGLIISLAVLVLGVLCTAVASHVSRPRHYGKLFLFWGLALAPVYFAAFLATPRDLWFLPGALLAGPAWLDAAYGFVIYILNWHNYVDFFFAFNGGFSMSLMFPMLQAGDKGMSAVDLIAGYIGPDGFDKIYGWRLPRLERMRCIEIDRASGTCRLTPKGRRVAALGAFLKHVFNLGAGG